MSEKLFYLQDTRTMVGNDIVWWAKEGRGYTTDLNKAQVFTEYEAMRQHENRATDRPWPKEYVDAKSRQAVDFQYVDYEIATQGL